MNKTELADALASRTGTSKAAAAAAINALFDGDSGIIAATLEGGDQVTLAGFGTFKVAERKARVATNPITKAKIQVPAKKSAKFVAGKNLKGTIAG